MAYVNFNWAIFSVLFILIGSPVFAAIQSDFAQCANKDPVLDNCHWIGSIIQQSNSRYFEGMSVPQRILFREVTSNGPHFISFNYQYTKAGIHAYDFLTTVNQGNNPALTLNECADLGTQDAAACNAVINNSPTLVLIPIDNFTSKDGLQNETELAFESLFGSRFVKVRANSPSAFQNAKITISHDVANGADTGDSSVFVNLSFNSSGCGSGANTCTYLIYLGGHLAVTGTNSSGINWGPGLGSSQISGGPYHFKDLKFDGSGGSQDNQIKGADILVPSAPNATLSVDKVTVPSLDPQAFAFTLQGPVSNTTSLNDTDPAETFQNLTPGAYNLTETPVSGWVLSNISCTNLTTTPISNGVSFNLSSGQAPQCIFYNTKLSTVVIKKIALPSTSALFGFSSTGGLSPSAFNLTDGGNQTFSNILPGNYSVTESGSASGYGLDGISCTSGGTGNVGTSTAQISLAAGSTVACNFTNKALNGGLTVIKLVINDNGGTATASSFLISVKYSNNSDVSGSPASGSESGSFYSLPTGIYSVSEAGVTGYVQTSIICDGQPTSTVNVTSGQNKTCTITNDDIAPILTVVKHVINDNGGSAIASNFTISITGSNVSPASFPGNENGTTISLNIGSYSVGENGQSGYGSSYSADCSGTINLGENKTCTVTNDDIAPQLTLIKTVVNDDGGDLSVGDFSLFIDEVSATSGTAYEVEANILHVASEVSQFGYVASVWGGDCAVDGSVTLAPGENKTCTITNDDIAPQLTLVKTVINDNGGDLNISDFPLFIDDVSATSGIAYEVEANTPHAASETGQFGYAASVWSGDCAANGSVVLAPGENKTCTITNDDVQPILTLVKTVVNDDGGNLQVSDFPLFVGDASVVSGQANGFDAGVYVASETSQFGYAASVWSGDCAEDGSVTLAPGENKTCTITNDDIAPQLTLVKTVINDNGGDLNVSDFPLFIGQLSAVSGTAYEVAANEGIVASEVSQFGYSASVWGGDCAANGSITLAPGENKTCTITNDDVQPILTLVKTVVNDNGGNLQVSDFPLFVGDALVVSGQANGFDAGVYVASETSQFGYSASVWGGDCAANGSVSLSVGENKTCTITNNDIPGVIRGIKFNDLNGNGIKDAGEPGLAGWAINVVGPLNVSTVTSVNGSYEFAGLSAGQYVVSEIQQTGWVQTTSNPAPIQLSLAGVVEEVNFGNFKLYNVTGTKFHDSDANGVFDTASEKGLGNWTIFLDANSNGVFDSGELFAVTGTNGNFVIAGVGPGIFNLTELMQSGWTQTAPATGTYQINGVSGQNQGPYLFGNVNDREGTIGLWRNWNKHNKYSQLQINTWMAKIDNQSAWLMPSGYAANTTGLVNLINDATKYCSGFSQIDCAKRKFYAQYLVLRLNVESGRKSLSSTYNLSIFGSTMSYLGITTTPTSLSTLFAQVEAKASTTPTRQQLLNMMSVFDYINNQGT